MTDVIPFPAGEEDRRQACVWLARLDRGLTPDEEVELKGWLAAAPARGEELLRVATLWDKMNALGDLADLFPLDQYQAQLGQGQHRLRWRPALLGACAAVAAAVILASALIGIVSHLTNASDQTETYRTAVGEQSTVRLADGSTITLNTDSELWVHYTGERRDVYLNRGEAYFEVAHAPDRPFYVHAGDRVVRAVGTAFNVQLAVDRELEVAVTEGTVELRLEGVHGRAAALPPRQGETLRATRLTVGEGLVLDGRSRVLEKLADKQITERLAWQDGMIVFDGDSLESAIHEIERYSRTRIRIGDSGLRRITVSGYFRAGDVDGLLVALKNNFGVTAEPVSTGSNTLRLTRRGSGEPDAASP